MSEIFKVEYIFNQPVYIEQKEKIIKLNIESGEISQAIKSIEKQSNALNEQQETEISKLEQKYEEKVIETLEVVLYCQSLFYGQN